MYKDKEISVLIPARGGSKGLPRKNIKPFLGKPLIAWTIGQAKESRYVDEVAVSTDDKEIAKISKRYGADIPIRRPKGLARDETPMIGVVIHFLKYLKSIRGRMPDFIILLQPTSPLRTVYDIDKAIEILLGHHAADAIVSMREVSESPFWMKELNKEGFIKNLILRGKRFHRRQDVPAVYIPNGSLYICRTSILLRAKTLFPKRTLGYVMPKERSIDIDDITDFKLAELVGWRKVLRVTKKWTKK